MCSRCQAAECVCPNYTINFIPQTSFPTSNVYTNNASEPVQYQQEAQTVIERPQNLIIMNPSSPTRLQEIPERRRMKSVSDNKVKNMIQNTSNIFEPVAGPSGLQRPGNIAPTHTARDSDSSDLEDDAEVAAMNLQKPGVIHQQPYRNITRAPNFRHFVDSDDSSECNQPPHKRTASQTTAGSISDGTDDDVIFISSTKEPATSIDLTLDDDDSNEVVSVSASTQTSYNQRRENVLHINNTISPLWESTNTNEFSRPHIMNRDSCLGVSYQINNNAINTSQTQQQPTAIVLNSNARTSTSVREQVAPPEVIIELENDSNTPVYNVGSAPSDGGITTNLRFNYNIPPQRPLQCPYMETYRNRYSPLRLINTLSNSPQSTQTEVTRLSLSPTPRVSATPSPSRHLAISPPNNASQQPMQPHPVGPGPAHQPPPPLAHSITCNSRRVHCSHYIPQPPVSSNLNRCTQIYPPPISVHPGVVLPNHHFYQPHHELWHRQQNQQEIHRRHNAPTPIDLSSARSASYRSSSCACHCTTAHSQHHHRPLPSSGGIGGAIRNLDSVSFDIVNPNNI